MKMKYTARITHRYDTQYKHWYYKDCIQNPQDHLRKYNGGKSLHTPNINTELAMMYIPQVIWSCNRWRSIEIYQKLTNVEY